jgi:hypothetical protein
MSEKADAASFISMSFCDIVKILERKDERKWNVAYANTSLYNLKRDHFEM